MAKHKGLKSRCCQLDFHSNISRNQCKRHWLLQRPPFSPKKMICRKILSPNKNYNNANKTKTEQPLLGNP